MLQGGNKMTLDTLNKLCQKIKGIAKTRKARLKDGIFLYYKETGGYFFTDFIHLDTWRDSYKRTKIEYERFFV